MSDEKPLSIKKQEFSDQIIDLVNNSDMPMFIVEYILKEILVDVHAISVNQYKLDVSNFNKDK